MSQYEKKHQTKVKPILKIVDNKVSDKNTYTLDEIIKKEGIYLIDFWASWCGPCRMMEPIYEEMNNDERLKNIIFCKCNVDENPVSAMNYNIRSIPTFVLLKSNGKELKKIETFIGGKNLEDFVKAILATNILSLN